MLEAPEGNARRRYDTILTRSAAARLLLRTAVRVLGTTSRFGDHRGGIDRGILDASRHVGNFARSRAAARPTHLTTIGTFDAAIRLSDRRSRRLGRHVLAAKFAGRRFWHSDQAAGLLDPATIGVRNAALGLNGRRIVRGHALERGLKAKQKRGDYGRNGHKSRQHDPDPFVNNKRELENRHTTDAPEQSSTGRSCLTSQSPY